MDAVWTLGASEAETRLEPTCSEQPRQFGVDSGEVVLGVAGVASASEVDRECGTDVSEHDLCQRRSRQ